MALTPSETCIFRQSPLGLIKSRTAARRMRAANDNVFRNQAVEETSADDTPSLADVGPLLALVAISYVTYHLICTMLSGLIKSFPSFYP